MSALAILFLVNKNEFDFLSVDFEVRSNANFEKNIEYNAAREILNVRLDPATKASAIERKLFLSTKRYAKIIEMPLIRSR